MPQLYSDNTFANAGVVVDYRKNKVNFNYEDPKKVKTYKSRFRWIFAGFFSLWIIALFLGGILSGLIGLAMSATISQATSEPQSIPQIMEELLIIGKSLGIGFMLILFPPIVLSAYALTRKDSQVFMPKFQAFLNSLFSPRTKVIFKKINEPIIKIDKFRNVLLEYKARGEFGKFLEKIEIKEHRSEKRWLGMIFGKCRWSAEFIFSKIPNKGQLEVEYL